MSLLGHSGHPLGRARLDAGRGTLGSLQLNPEPADCKAPLPVSAEWHLLLFLRAFTAPEGAERIHHVSFGDAFALSTRRGDQSMILSNRVGVYVGEESCKASLNNLREEKKSRSRMTPMTGATGRPDPFGVADLSQHEAAKLIGVPRSVLQRARAAEMESADRRLSPQIHCQHRQPSRLPVENSFRAD